MTLRLEADDARVLALTRRAIEESVHVKPVKIRCAGCHSTVALVGSTASGPLFISSWPAERPVGHVVRVDGVELPPPAARKWMQKHHPLVAQSGAPVDRPEVHGAIALLALPPALPQDYPDLLVRCDKHGDELLERHTVLEWLRDRSAPKVALDFPHREYRRPTDALGTTSEQSEVRQLVRAVRVSAEGVEYLQAIRDRHHDGTSSDLNVAEGDAPHVQ